MRQPIASLLIAALATACTSPPLPQLQAWEAAGGTSPPPQSRCPYVAKIDLRRIGRRASNVVRGRGDEGIRRYFDEIVIPASAAHRPSGDERVVLRAVQPPAGMYPNTVWSVVWKEPDGGWWFWSQNRDPMIPPVLKPPPSPDSPEGRAYWANGSHVAELEPDEVRWPPSTGRLSAREAALLDEALAAPCRAWEPDVWPMHPPLRGRRSPKELLPQDWTPTYVELSEPGRPTRFISGALDLPSHIRTLASIAASPQGEH